MGILGLTFQRQIGAATPENPRFSLNDPASWAAFGVSRSDVGIPINREVAFTYGPWWRAVNLLSGDVAKLPLHTFKRTAAGKVRDKEHPGFRLLRRRANERQTAYHWKRLMIVHGMTEGNGYSVIQRNGGGEPVELLPLDPQLTSPLLVNGLLWYVTTVGGSQRKIRPEDMFHVAGMGFDGLQGYRVWEKALNTLGLGVGGLRYATTVLKNNGRPSIIIQHPNKLTKETAERLVRDWDRMHAGIDNAARTAILDQGMTANEISFSPRQNELTGLMEFSTRDVSNYTGVPPHKLGDNTRNSYNSLEQENLAYLSEGLDPWLINFEEEAYDKILTEEEKADDSHSVEFDRRPILLSSLDSRANYFSTALGGGPWMKENEVREFEGLEPNEGGDEMQRPLNMSTAEQEAGGKEEETTAPVEDTPDPAKKNAQGFAQQQAIRGAARAAVRDVVTRIVRRVANHAERAAAKGGDTFVAFADTIVREHREVAFAACVPAQALAQALYGSMRPDELAGWTITHIAQGWTALADRASASELAEAVAGEAARQEQKLPAAAADTFLPFKEESR